MLADSFYWEAFSRFGSALQRQGVTVVRLTGRPVDLPNKIQLGLQHMLFPRLTYVDGWNQESVALATATLVQEQGPRPVAVEASDDIAAAFAASPPGSSYRRTSGVAKERWLYDKLALTHFLSSVGVDVPRTGVALPDVGLGSHVVVKRKLGFGGRGVKIVEAQPALVHQARTQLSLAVDDVFLQELVEGETLHAGGVALDGRALVCAAYRSGATAGDLGPASSITIIEDPGLVREVAVIIGALGYTGSFSIDFVRDRDGLNRFIDFNGRVFGSWLGLQRAGLDFLGAYRYAYGLSDTFDDRLATPGRRVGVQWTRAVGDLDLPFLRTYARSLAQSVADSRVLGARWLVVAVAETTGAAALRLGRALRRSSSAIRPRRTRPRSA